MTTHANQPHKARGDADEPRESTPASDDALTNLGREIELLAASASLAKPDDADALFERAAVLRDNAMGIIYDGDGSTEQERIGRLIALVPALLTVVDEARDTIERLREAAGEKDPPKLISPYDVAGKGEPRRPTWDN